MEQYFIATISSQLAFHQICHLVASISFDVLFLDDLVDLQDSLPRYLELLFVAFPITFAERMSQASLNWVTSNLVLTLDDILPFYCPIDFDEFLPRSDFTLPFLCPTPIYSFGRVNLFNSYSCTARLRHCLENTFDFVTIVVIGVNYCHQNYQ